MNDSDFTFGKPCKPFYNSWHYWLILSYMCLGILLEVDDEIFQKVIKIRDRVPTPDFLLDYLLSFKDGREVHQETIAENQFKSRVKLLKEKGADMAAADFNKYLIKQWFKDYKRMGWEESHMEDYHTGYWSFETRAIVKILKIDDSSLKGVPYYPYDLV